MILYDFLDHGSHGRPMDALVLACGLSGCYRGWQVLEWGSVDVIIFRTWML